MEIYFLTVLKSKKALTESFRGPSLDAWHTQRGPSSVLALERKLGKWLLLLLKTLILVNQGSTLQC